MLFLAVLPDRVLGSAVTPTEFLNAATGPIASLTTDTSSRDISSALWLLLVQWNLDSMLSYLVVFGTLLEFGSMGKFKQKGIETAEKSG